MEKSTFEKKLKTSLKHLKRKHPDENLEKYEVALRKVFEEGMQPKEALGFSEELVEQMYTYAESLYSTGNYKKALDTFIFLKQLDPTDQRFWMGVAASFHRMKNYDMAIVYYFSLLNLDREDPLPYYYLSDCFESQGNEIGACMVLNGFINRAKNNAKYSAMVARAQATLEKVEKTLEKKR
jgi:type III secretion system low calcium response chaperone LcrH/SycD